MGFLMIEEGEPQTLEQLTQRLKDKLIDQPEGSPRKHNPDKHKKRNVVSKSKRKQIKASRRKNR